MASSLYNRDIIVLSSDDDDVPPRPSVRAGKRRAEVKPGEEQRDAHPKRPRLSDSNTTVSAPPGLLGKGKSRDVSISHQRPTHRPSASSNLVQQSPKRQTVQRTISAAFADVPKRPSMANQQRKSSSSGQKYSSSDDGLPPSSSAFKDLFNIKAPEGGKQIGANKAGPSRSVSGSLSQSQNSRIQFSGDNSEEFWSPMGSSVSAPIRKSSQSRPVVIEVPDSDDEPPKSKFKSKPYAPPKAKHKPVQSSSSTSNSTSSASGYRSNGPPSTIKPTSKSKSIPKTPPKGGPSSAKPKPKPKISSAEPDIICIDMSDDELLLSPTKLPPKDSVESLIPTRLPPLNIGNRVPAGSSKAASVPSTKDVFEKVTSSMKPPPTPSEARTTSTALMQAQRKEKEASVSSTPMTRTPSNDSSGSGQQPLLDLKSLSIGKKRSPPSSSISTAIQSTAQQPPAASGSVVTPATVGSLASALAMAHRAQAKEKPASGTADTVSAINESLPITSTTPPPGPNALPFGRATLLRSPPKAVPSSTASTSNSTPSRALHTPFTRPSSSSRTLPNTSAASAASSSSDVSSRLKEIPAISGTRPAHSRKSSGDVRKELTGIQDGIDAMMLEGSSTAQTNIKDPRPATHASKPTSAVGSNILIPDSLPPISLPSWAPACSSAPSTPPKNRPVSTSQAKATVSPIRHSQPSSPAATAVKKPAKPKSPAVGSSNARSGELTLADILDQAPALWKAPVLELTRPSPSGHQSQGTTPAITPASQTSVPSSAPRRLALPSRSSLGIAGTSSGHSQSEGKGGQSPARGPFSWKPKDKDGDTFNTSGSDTAGKAEPSSTRGPFSWKPKSGDGDTVGTSNAETVRNCGSNSKQGPFSWAPNASDGDNVDMPGTETTRITKPAGSSAQDMTTLGTNDLLQSQTSAIISGVLDMPVHQQTPMLPPTIVSGHAPRSSGTYEVSSPPLPFLRDASSPLSQSDPGPPSSRSPSAPHSSPDMAALTEFGKSDPATSDTIRQKRREVVPGSSSPPGDSGSSNESSHGSSSERRQGIPISQRIARKTTHKHAVPMPPAISAKPRKTIARKTMGHRVPSPLKQVAPKAGGLASDYNAATSSSGGEAARDDKSSSGQRRTRKTRNLVQSDSDSEAAVHQSLSDNQPTGASSNDEPPSSEAEGSRRRPRRAVTKKKISYYIPMEDEQLPSEEETNPIPSISNVPAAAAYSDDDEDDLPITVKTYGGFQVSSWAAYRKDLSNFSIKTRFSRDLSTRLQDQINSWPEYMKQQKTLTTIFKAAIVEHTAEDEPNAPPIDVVNDIDLEPTPPWEFYYSNHMWYGEGVAPPDLTKLRSCGCIGRCDPNSDKCACVRRQRAYMPDDDQGFHYDPRGKAKRTAWPIFECNKLCGCDEDCQNRVVQNGRQVSISIQKTKNKGWGVFAGAKKIPKGTFVGIYAGELITNEEGNIRGKDYDKFGRTYLFDIDFWHLQKTDEKGKIINDVKYTVDAFHAGNFTRFLNHHCEPNCVLVPVYIDEPDIEKPLLVLFSSRDIVPFEEICFSYYGEGDAEEESKDEELEELADSTKNDAVFLTKCECGAPSCKGRLWRA